MLCTEPELQSVNRYGSAEIRQHSIRQHDEAVVTQGPLIKKLRIFATWDQLALEKRRTVRPSPLRMLRCV